VTGLPIWLAGWEVGCCARGVGPGSQFETGLLLEADEFVSVLDEDVTIEVVSPFKVRGIAELVGFDEEVAVLDVGSLYIGLRPKRAMLRGRYRFSGELWCFRHGPGSPEAIWSNGVIYEVFRARGDELVRQQATPTKMVVGHTSHEYLLMFEPSPLDARRRR
jgi:hypothetical protein